MRVIKAGNKADNRGQSQLTCPIIQLCKTAAIIYCQSRSLFIDQMRRQVLYYKQNAKKKCHPKSPSTFVIPFTNKAPLYIFSLCIFHPCACPGRRHGAKDRTLQSHISASDAGKWRTHFTSSQSYRTRRSVCVDFFGRGENMAEQLVCVCVCMWVHG